MDNYQQLLDRVSQAAGMEKGEVERRVEAKRAKLSGLVSREGAVQIVAAELGVNLDQERLKLNELVEGMKRANVVGKVLNISPVRSYIRNGKEGKVSNLVIADEFANTKVVLWDTNHISLVESGKIKEGDVVEIANAGVRGGELHLSSFGDLKLSKEKFGEVIMERSFANKEIGNIKSGQGGKLRAFVVQVFEPRYYEACPKCRKKVNEGKCVNHGEIQGEKRALLNLVIDDGNETMRAVIVGENINKLGLENEEIFSLEKFDSAKSKLIGEEKYFFGNVRSNTLYNTVEFNVDNVEEVNPQELVKELEGK